MKQHINKLFFLALCSMPIAHMCATPEDDLAFIAQLAPEKSHQLLLLCEKLQNKETPSQNLIENGCIEAFECLTRLQNHLTKDEIEQLGNSIETTYDQLMEQADNDDIATKASKKIFSQVVVRQKLNSGSLYVGGDTIINHNLQVNNDLTVQGDEIIQGDLIVQGATIFSGTQVTLSGNQIINGNLTVLGNTTTNGIQSTGTNILTGPTNINTSGTAATNIGNSTNSTTIQGTQHAIGNTFMSAINGVVLTVTGNITSSAAILVGNGTTAAPALKLIGNPAAYSGNLVLQIDPLTNIVTQGAITTATSSSNAVINGGQPGPITIAATGATSTIALGSCSDTVDIEGTLTINTSCATPTTIGNTTSITTVDGLLVLPVANGAGTQGLIELGGTVITDNIQLYDFGTRNLFAGNYTSPNVSVTGTDNISMGTEANSTLTGANYTVAIGNGAQATSDDSIAIGRSTNSNAGVAIGAGSNASTFSVAIGTSYTFGISQVAIGNGAGALTAQNNSVAIGNSAAVAGANAVALGGFSNAGAANAVALGSRAVASNVNSIVINASNAAFSDTGGAGTFINGIRGVTTYAVDAIPVLISSTGQLGTISSARKFKKNFRSLDAHSEKLYKLNPVLFDYVEEHSGAKDQIGLIADEVAQHIPEIVVHDKDGEIYSVQYHILPTLLLNEMKHQKQTLDEYKQELAELRAQVATLTAALARIK